VLQATVFIGWCLALGDGSPAARDCVALDLGFLLMLVGQILSSLVFYRLGRVGIFFGDRLGHEVHWCHAFPFSMLTHPQYVGAVMTIWGFFLITRFPHDDWILLPVLETIYYVAGACLEADGARWTGRDTEYRAAPPDQSATEHGEDMSEPRFRTIWLSDTHLGTPDCRAEALLAFLEAHDCDFLYLVGDIIDFWRLKRASYWAPAHSDVLRRVVAKARAGTLVTFVPGNHDEYARRFCDVQLGNIMIVREAVHRTADGRLLLVLHGDEFDAVTRWNRRVAWLGDLGYGLLMRLNRWLNRARRLLGFGHWSLAGYVWKVERALQYIDEFEQAAAREGARRGMDGVVCGHIHKFAVRSIGAVLYCNTGDWV
jgi:UDP-2,3-diacylglucosamine pyrophosphatase LpxH